MFKHKLKLTNQSASDMLDDLASYLKEIHNISIKFIKQPYGSGYIHTEALTTTLYVGNLYPIDRPETNPKTSVSDNNFLHMITAMFHELTHHHQNKYIYQKNNPSQDDVYMTLHQIATQNNRFYYKPFDNYNYLHDPSEIMAEYQAITNTYEYLQNQFSHITSKTKEKLMVDYVNNCQYHATNGYWIHSKKPFQSMEEIENAFEIAYKKSKFIKRKYFEYENQTDILDENMRFMKQYPEIIQRFENANTGYQQDKIMACIACYLHPRFKDYYQSIQSVDLSPKTVLDMQLQEEPFFDYHPEIKHDRTAALAFYEEKFNTETPYFDNDFDYP